MQDDHDRHRQRSGACAWTVDYRMPPDFPFPTPLDDCLTAYRALLDERRPHEIIVGGTSAGGNLAAALILRARDEGLPLPAAAVFNTGAFDLTGSGDSWQINDGLDNVLSGPVEPCTELYAGSHDRREPHISPLFADLTGLPPVILLTGTTRPAPLRQRADAPVAAEGRGRGRAPRVGGSRTRWVSRDGAGGHRTIRGRYDASRGRIGLEPSRSCSRSESAFGVGTEEEP